MYDVTFENVQAGERTSHLFRLANFHNALVVGTGDLSELALGWATYGVGDQMSHYNVNVSVPKTLIQYLIRWAIGTEQFDERTSAVLQAVLETEISPELVPPTSTGGATDEVDDAPAQSTEAMIGPFELQDFNLYYLTRYGFRPSKVAYLSEHAWSDRTRGAWPEGFPEDRKHEYDLPTIKRWLEVFLLRFFQNEPVQALGHTQRAQSRLRRLALAARRLARPQRRRGGGVAGGAAGACAGVMPFAS